MKLIIRDDDANFFTHPEDIEKAYSEIPDFPVSFAVVPMVVDVIGVEKVKTLGPTPARWRETAKK